MEEIHMSPTRIGNSWGFLIPKQTADKIRAHNGREYHVTIAEIPKLKEVFGTFKPKKSIQEIRRELKGDWRE